MRPGRFLKRLIRPGPEQGEASSDETKQDERPIAQEAVADSPAPFIRVEGFSADQLGEPVSAKTEPIESVEEPPEVEPEPEVRSEVEPEPESDQEPVRGPLLDSVVSAKPEVDPEPVLEDDDEQEPVTCPR
jgi:hypothetical protein